MCNTNKVKEFIDKAKEVGHPKRYMMILCNITEKIIVIEYENASELAGKLEIYRDNATIVELYEEKPNEETIKKMKIEMLSYRTVEEEREAEKRMEYMNEGTDGKPSDQPGVYYKMTMKDREHLINWIVRTFKAGIDENKKIGNSKEIKERYVKFRGDITNGQLKGAMIQVGFYPCQKTAEYAYYKIKRKND